MKVKRMLQALLGRLGRHGPTLQRAMMNMLLLLVGFSVALGGYSLVKQRDAVKEACVIQQRGLAAERHLTRFFVAWDQLVGLQRKQTAKTLRGEPPRQRQLTDDAIAELHAYAVISARQPKHRTCP